MYAYLPRHILTDNLKLEYEDGTILIAAPEPLDSQFRTVLSRDVRKLVAALPKRHADILTMRFGLDGGDERTLEEVGQKMRLSRERIRQLEREALVMVRKLVGVKDARNEGHDARVEARNASLGVKGRAARQKPKAGHRHRSVRAA